MTHIDNNKISTIKKDIQNWANNLRENACLDNFKNNDNYYIIKYVNAVLKLFEVYIDVTYQLIEQLHITDNQQKKVIKDLQDKMKINETTNGHK